MILLLLVLFTGMVTGSCYLSMKALSRINQLEQNLQCTMKDVDELKSHANSVSSSFNFYHNRG